MARRALDLGEVGEPQLVGQVMVDGRWVDAGRRKPQRFRARAYYRGFDGIRRNVAVTASSRRRAAQALEDRIAERLRGAGDIAMTAATPLVVAGTMWLRQIGRSDSGLSQRTIDDYSRTFARCIDA